MEVYLIRHTTPLVAPGTVYGHLDVPLADTFEAESKSVVQQIPVSVDQVYTSPSRRCTALATLLSPHAACDHRLREMAFGAWEGREWNSVPPEELDPWMEDFVSVSPPGGESLLEMNDRVLSFWHELQQQPFRKAAIVTHAGVIRIITAHTNGTPLSSIFDLKVAYGEVFRVMTP